MAEALATEDTEGVMEDTATVSFPHFPRVKLSFHKKIKNLYSQEEATVTDAIITAVTDIGDK